MARSKARDDGHRLANRKAATADLTRTELDSIVLCEDKNLIMEEAPHAYKNVDDVVQDLVDEGIIDVVASLRPVVTYKLRAVVR